jgi:hypothetical protein
MPLSGTLKKFQPETFNLLWIILSLKVRKKAKRSPAQLHMRVVNWRSWGGTLQGYFNNCSETPGPGV